MNIFSSLKILIDIISKENYDSKVLLYNIVKTLPSYVNIEEKLFLFLTIQMHHELNLFSVDCLIYIFEIFEDLCWKEIKKNINYDYKLVIPEEYKTKIIKYFEDNKNEKKLINKSNFTQELRKFISRYLANTREKSRIDSIKQLRLFILREDLWKENIDKNDNFEHEIMKILIKDIMVGHAYDLYNILEGDSFLNKFIEGNNLEIKIELNSEKDEDNKEGNEEEIEEEDERDI